ncbi:tetratricopeptide repeat protein [Pleurocapsales cyanobacterium LEGE 06147]|nr:tetratricopeptide repeat protein [Pleurocapsales cyanobacterium LEGE 06147]
MFKLLQNLWQEKSLSAEAVTNSNTSIEISHHDSLEATLEQANSLWQQGKLTHALNLYRRAIQHNPNANHIYEHLALALKQQDNLAEAYEQLANSLKQQGQVAEAADYYRQAIVLKSLIGKAKEKYLRPIPANRITPPLQVANLSEEAFSFQPLSSNSQRQDWQNVTPKNRDDNPIPDFLLGDLASADNSDARSKRAASVYIKQALEHYEQQQWGKTASACQKAIQIDPNRAEVYKIWGNALQRMGKTAQAMDCYAKVVAIEPNLAAVYVKIGSWYAWQEKWQQASQYYQKAIIIQPSFVEAYRHLAYCWHQLGQPEKALECSDRALKLEAEQTNGKKVTNQTNSLNKSDGAITTFELKINPQSRVSSEMLRKTALNNFQSVEFYRQLAKNLERENYWQEAAFCYRQALELNLSANTNTYQQQSLLQDESTRIKKLESQNNSEESQLDKAIRRYRQQANLNPNSAKIQTDLGNLYKKKRQWKVAVACYQKAIALDSQYARAYLNLAKILVQEGKLEKAADYLYRALSLKPELAPAKNHFYLGNTFCKQGKLEQAIDCYKRAVDLQPNFPEVYYRLGEIWSRRGQKRQAIDCYQKAVELEPKNPEFYHCLGRELMSQQQWKEAVQAFRRVLELQPNFPEGSYLLNRALAKKLKSNITSNK